MNQLKRLAALALIFVFALSMALSGCAESTVSAFSAANSSSSSHLHANGSSQSADVEEPLVGKPWVTSTLSGNLPSRAPEAKDDLYTHFDYDYLSSHEGRNAAAIADCESEIKDAVVAVVKDKTKTGHDLDQLRIFYNQAADAETVIATGYSDIQPYLDRIDAVTSIDEMNDLLASEDFPFSPFIAATLSMHGTDGVNIVGISPNFLFCDELMDGGTYYQDYDDPQTQEAMDLMNEYASTFVLIDLLSMDVDQDIAQTTIDRLMSFEKAHGKYLEGQSTFLKMDFGAYAQALSESYYSLDELCSLCPNFPLRETLAKCGKAGSPEYMTTKEWAEAFNGLWTQQNLGAIKDMAKANIVAETRSLHDPSLMNQMLAFSGEEPLDADAFAFQASDDMNTFGQLLGKMYVDEKLGPKAKERLTKLSELIVEEYKELVNETAWMSDDSKTNVIEKLDHMSLNILEPESGYFDYSGLELTPTEKGGTLLSNYLKLKQYRYDCESKMIGQPAVSSPLWYSVAPTVMNAFYSPESNSINIYPGFVTSFVYSDDMSDAELLGRMGWVIGHEVSHGFDYQGAQIDAYGKPNPVVTEADVDKFVTKCTTLAFCYQDIEMEPGLMVDGQNVVGEAAADLSGMQVALEILAKEHGDREQFFEAAASMWAQVIPLELFPVYATDVHPLSNLRVNVNAQMFDAFYDTFDVEEGDGMYLSPKERIVIWGPNA